MSDEQQKKLEELLKEQREEAKKTRDWVAKVVDTKYFDQASDALDEMVKKLRAEGCDRNAFVIAALVCTISIDLSDDISPERLVDLLRKFMVCGEVVISKRRDEAMTDVIRAGGAQA